MVILGKWSVPQLIDIIENYKVTFTYIPSPVIDEFVAAVAASPHRVTSLRSVLHSASKAGPDKLRALYQVLGDTLVEGLGMTENSGGLVTATRPGDFAHSSPAADPFAPSAVVSTEPTSTSSTTPATTFRTTAFPSEKSSSAHRRLCVSTGTCPTQPARRSSTAGTTPVISAVSTLQDSYMSAIGEPI